MPDTFETDVASAISRLEEARRKLTREISTYPTPVSGCDVQYNHLLSERHKVSNALSVLAEQPFIPTPRIPVAGARVESR